MTGSWVVPGVQVLGAGPVVDVTVSGGVIAEIAPSRDPIERILLPGLVDLHTHLREPGDGRAETIATGTAAAAAGGFTDVFAMPNTTPVVDSTELVRDVRRRAIGASARVHPVAALSKGQQGEQLVDLEGLAAEGVRLFSDDGRCLERDDLALAAMTRLAPAGGVFAQHAQSTSIVGRGVIDAEVAAEVGVPGWPVVGEEVVVARDLALARRTGAHLHVCHVSSACSLDLVRWGRSVGVDVTVEVTPHHLALTNRDAVEHGEALKVNPPLRAVDHAAALRAALVDGTIDAVATDHAPHPAGTKSCGWEGSAFGLTGLETALAVVISVLSGPGGRVDWARVVQVLADGPRRIGGLPVERPGVGAPATFTVVERREWVVGDESPYSRSSNAAFRDRTLGHRPVLTVLDGRVTYRSESSG